jgi:gliding motility-associated-like protein
LVVSPGILEIKFSSPDSVTIPGQDHLLDLNFSGLTSGRTDLDWKLVECAIYSATGYEMPTIYTNGSADIRPVPQIYTEGSGGYCEKTPIKLNAGSLTGSKLDYEWTGPDGSIHSGAKWNLGAAKLSDAGVYQVTAHDGPVCATTETLKVEVYENPNVSLSANDTLCSEQVISLNAGLGFDAYKWQDGSTEPQIEVSTDGLYWVVVTDYNGCKASDSVILKQCELLLWMPNIFTPDGDGLNDIFLPVYKLDVEIKFQMYIFNKWGEQIFSTNEISKGWDGTYKGVLCTQDLYTWRIIFSAPDNHKFRQISPQSGNVMLLK